MSIMKKGDRNTVLLWMMISCSSIHVKCDDQVKSHTLFLFNMGMSSGCICTVWLGKVSATEWRKKCGVHTFATKNKFAHICPSASIDI